MKKTISIFIIFITISLCTCFISARPIDKSAAHSLVKQYLLDRMNSITSRQTDVLDKYFSKHSEVSKKYLLISKQAIIQDFIICYSKSGYVINQAIPEVNVVASWSQSSYLNVLATVNTKISWSFETDTGNSYLGNFCEKHMLKLMKEDNQWKIINDCFYSSRGSSQETTRVSLDSLRENVEKLKKEALEGFATQAGTFQIKSNPSASGNKTKAVLTETAYDREKAREWAKTYWKNYSNQYVNLGKNTWDGGDCTNFVSQCLRAGGAANDMKGVNRWYYIRRGSIATSSDSYSWTWSIARGLNSILLGNQKTGEFGPKGVEKVISKDSDYYDELGDFVTVGDIIQYEWSKSTKIKHSAIIVGMVYNSNKQRKEPVISTHSFDSWNLPWTKKAYKTHFVHVEGVN